MKTLNLVLCCDEKIAKYVPVLLNSIFRNNPEYTVNVYLIHYRISAETIYAIQEYVDHWHAPPSTENIARGGGTSPLLCRTKGTYNWLRDLAQNIVADRLKHSSAF